MATVQWRWTATRPSGWVASTTATGLTERLCSTSCCGTSARSSQSSTPTTAWPAELTRPDSTRSGRSRHQSGAEQAGNTWTLHSTEPFSVDSCRLSVESTGFCWILLSPWLPVCSLIKGLLMLCYCGDIYKVFMCLNVFFVLTQQRKSLIFCDVCGEKWPTILINRITWVKN